MDRTARLWDAKSGKLIKELRHSDGVYAVAFGADGKTALTAANDSRISMWDVPSGELIHSFQHESSAAAVKFSPDGARVFICSGNAIGQVRDLRTWHKIGPTLPHWRRATAAAFSPDGLLLVTQGEQDAAYVYRIPQPVEASADQLALALEVATGLEMERPGSYRAVTGEKWRTKRELLRSDAHGPIRRALSLLVN